MHDIDIQVVLNKVLPIVKKAGDMVCDAFGREKKINYKGRMDLVTETDVTVEQMLIDNLSPILPEATFLAEESGRHDGTGELTWIIDPLDGTTNFAHGLPFVANSVALWARDRVVLGVVNLPLMQELFWATEGGGAFMNGKQLATSDVISLEDAVIATGFPYAIEEHLTEVIKNLEKLLPLVQGIRRPGAAAMDLAYVAAGRFDGFYETALNPWDTAAGILLVQEAGGRVTEYDSDKSYTFSSPNIMATNGGIHGILSQTLR